MHSRRSTDTVRAHAAPDSGASGATFWALSQKQVLKNVPCFYGYVTTSERC
jgi:hypothetical protein